MSFLLKDVESDLEFDKVRAIVSRECRSQGGLDYILSVKPYKSKDDALEELEALSEMRKLLEVIHSFPCFGYLSQDLLTAISLSGAVLDSEYLLLIRSTLSNIRELREKYDEEVLNDFFIIGSAVKNLFFDEDFLMELERTLDNDGSIKESASPELAAARREQASIKASIETHLTGYLKDTRYKECFDTAYITTINDRFVIPVYANFKGRIGGVVQGTSNSGNSVFVEPLKVVEMNNALMSARAREKAEIHRILAALTSKASMHSDDYVRLSWQLSWFDALYAKARYGNLTSSSQAVFSDSMELNLKNARHPLLGEDCIPLSMVLEDNHRVIILSGANSGGKTVTLKTIGLAALMARTGFHILADENSVIPFFPLIFVEIGDRQSIFEHLSSFSSHITDISHILKRVAPGSLILLDEIMSGTDPEEGAVLAEAVLKSLCEKGCLVLATTHFGTLKLLSGKNEYFRNYAVEFNAHTFEPTFRLLCDVPGASYGFEIARRFGLPSEIVDAAGELLGDGRHRISELVLKLEKELTAAENLARNHQKNSAKVEKLARALEKEKDRFDREKEEKLEALIEEERAALLAFRKSVEEDLSCLRAYSERGAESGTGKRQISRDNGSSPSPEKEQGIWRSSILRKMDKKLVSLKGKHKNVPVRENSPKVLSEGALVKTIDGTMKGTVLKVNTSKQSALVDCSGVELTVSLSEIEVVETVPAQSGNRSPKKSSFSKAVKTPLTSYTAEITSSLPYELDLRGMRVHEALEKLEAHIDLAIVRHESSVRIIHGKGTGALKRAVEEFLHCHPVISAYRRGKQGEGDFGVTIATLS